MREHFSGDPQKSHQNRHVFDNRVLLAHVTREACTVLDEGLP